MDMQQFIGTVEGRNSFSHDMSSNVPHKITVSAGVLIHTFSYPDGTKRVWSFDADSKDVIEELRDINDEVEHACCIR